MPEADVGDALRTEVLPGPILGDGLEPGSAGAAPVVARRWPRLSATTRREIVLALALLFCYGFFQQLPAWNEYSRYDLVRALVEDGTTRIDRFEGNTGDDAFYAGHYYSDKPPGSALLGVPPYLMLTAVYDAAGAGTPDQRTAVGALAFFVSGVPTVLVVLLLLRFLRPAVGEAWAFVMALAYGLGSIAFPFATMYFGHAASTFFLFAAFYLLWRWRSDPRPWRPILAGLLAGCAVITEIPVVVGVVVLGGYALWIGRRRVAWFVAGGVPILLVLMAYDWLTFGGPFNLGYQYATVFAEQNRQGIVSIVWPSLGTAVDLLVSPRGLLRFAPWFCLAPLGLLAWRRRVLRPEIAVCVAVCCVFLLYNSGALNPFGGWTPGPRYLLPALPFATVLVALAPSAVRPVAAVLVAIGVAFMFVATATMPNAPEAFADPLFGLWLPRLLGGEIAETIAWPRWGLHGIQPLFVLVFGLSVAGLALVTTHRSEPGSGRRTGLLGGILALLIVVVALPVRADRRRGPGRSRPLVGGRVGRHRRRRGHPATGRRREEREPVGPGREPRPGPGGHADRLHRLRARRPGHLVGLVRRCRLAGG